jgi:hypothetical protein
MKGPTGKPERPSMLNALEALAFSRRKPHPDDDRPPPSTFPGRKAKHILGQITIDDEKKGE